MRNATFVLFAAATLTVATPSIGIIQASGHFTVEGSQLWGNSTLFDGATVETSGASSDLSLRNGVRLQLGKDSKARVWENRLLLEKGTGQVSGGARYELEAAGLRIHTQGRVRVDMGREIEVLAVSSGARVTNGAGLLLASIPAGQAMQFAMQAAQNSIVMRSGCLLYKDNQFILQDDATMEVLELHGANLAGNTGSRVDVTGVPSATRTTVTPATVYLNVSTVMLRAAGGCLSAASALDARTTVTPGANTGTPTTPASTPTAAAKSGGLSTGAKIGIVAAVAGGGVGAAVALSGGKKSSSP